VPREPREDQSDVERGIEDFARTFERTTKRIEGTLRMASVITRAKAEDAKGAIRETKSALRRLQRLFSL